MLLTTKEDIVKLIHHFKGYRSPTHSLGEAGKPKHISNAVPPLPFSRLPSPTPSNPRPLFSLVPSRGRKVRGFLWTLDKNGRPSRSRRSPASLQRSVRHSARSSDCLTNHPLHCNNSAKAPGRHECCYERTL